MAETLHRSYQLPDRTYQALVRSELRKMAEAAGFTAHRLGEIEIIIAEITSNLVKHSLRGGTILCRILVEPLPGIEFIVFDDGPGIRTPARMMEDGKSSKKTLGQGLGAIRRLSDEFDIYSLIGWGTAIYCRAFVNRKLVERKLPGFTVAVIAVPKPNETFSGDGYKVVLQGKRIRVSLIDGLGHGEIAHQVAEEAIKTILQELKPTPLDQLKGLHTSLKKTRGGVVTLVHIDPVHRQLSYCGVGNIIMKIVTPSHTQGCLSYNGIVGHIMPASLKNHIHNWNEKVDMLVMHSDGLSNRWDLQKYPGLLTHHPALICAAIYKDFNRGNDDSTILIGKYLT